MLLSFDITSVLTSLPSQEIYGVLSGIIVFLCILFFVRTRRFYFVRHGETILNAEYIHQGKEGSLSPKGIQQSEKIGQYLSHFPIERIVASTYPRAKETAEIINKHFNVQIMYSPFLMERRNSSEIVGQKSDNPDVIHIEDKIDMAYHSDDYRFSDEENFMKMKTRARKCLNHLARQGAREMVVVTHHVFLKMLIAYLLYRERLHATDFVKLSFFNYSNNTSVTIGEFNPWKICSATRGWRIVSYNEQPKN